MKSWKIIIGANYGDEGKGLFTDYFVSQSKEIPLVVRFNGGAQAGHTVQLGTGQRFTFSHCGSGTLSNAPTYLAAPFIVNVAAYCIERENIEANFGIQPKIYVNPNCLVTTPIDVGFNQTIEQLRGDNRHGSCGLGISETVERSLRPKYKLTVRDCENPKRINQVLKNISDSWLPYRAGFLGIGINKLKEIAEFVMFDWIRQLGKFLDTATITDDRFLIKENNVIFEGAQGLALDQSLFSKTNPYVTRSNCGIRNVYDIAMGLEKEPYFNITYVTRCYITRHGAGPLNNELPLPSWLVDTTNKYNQWQGQLRYAPLDIDEINKRILHDVNSIYYSNLSFNTAVTCLDQIDMPINLSPLINHKYLSFGPTRNTIKNLSP